MKVRCNNCMAIFDEDKIVISEDPLYFKDEEICPKCSKGGALMDIPEFNNQDCTECKKNGFNNDRIYKEGLCNEHYDLKHKDEGLEE